LTQFYEEQLSAAGFEGLGPPLEGLFQASISFRAPDGAYVDIVLIDEFDGTAVDITVTP
ncbi:MAG: hypothetical protein GYB66_10640, partial [Chloroflexi bacterium]|nr:hypothetical protein [Chloroflexota bacterium]